MPRAATAQRAAGAPDEVLTMASIRAAYSEGLEPLRPGGRPAMEAAS